MKLPKLNNRSVLRASVAGVVATMFAMSAAAETNVEFIAGVIGDPFYNSMECGAREAAAEFGVTLSWTGPTDWDIEVIMRRVAVSISAPGVPSSKSA